jgi:hypothetical protein
LPPDATVLVVSNGDEELLQLGANRRGWHFPQMEDGTYAGYHPADSAEAIAHFEALREKGSTHILFPKTAFWWLDFYSEFASYLRPERHVLSESSPAAVFRCGVGPAAQLVNKEMNLGR